MKMRVDYRMQSGKSLAFYRVTLAFERSIFVNELSPKRQLLSVDAQLPNRCCDVGISFCNEYFIQLDKYYCSTLSITTTSHGIHSMMDIYRKSLLRANRPMYRPQCVVSVIYTSLAHWTAMMWGVVNPFDLCEHQNQIWTRRGKILQLNNWHRIETVIYLSWERNERNENQCIDVNRRIKQENRLKISIGNPIHTKMLHSPTMANVIVDLFMSMNDGRLVHIASMRRVRNRLNEIHKARVALLYFPPRTTHKTDGDTISQLHIHFGRYPISNKFKNYYTTYLSKYQILTEFTIFKLNFNWSCDDVRCRWIAYLFDSVSCGKATMIYWYVGVVSFQWTKFNWMTAWLAEEFIRELFGRCAIESRCESYEKRKTNTKAALVRIVRRNGRYMESDNWKICVRYSGRTAKSGCAKWTTEVM